MTVAVLLVQSLGEEVLFRGYLFRIWGAVVPHRLLVLLPISATFIALHTLNDDFKQDPPGGYIQFIVGEAIAYFMVMRTGSLAAGWGLHWLNNAWAFAILPTVPGQSFDVAIAIYRSPVLEQGRSNVGDPLSVACFVLGVGLLLVLLLWRGSPLYLAPGAWQPLPVERPVPAPHDEQPATPIV